jgi:hypothetical protein
MSDEKCTASAPHFFRTLKGTQFTMNQIMYTLRTNGSARIVIDGEMCILLGISREDGSGKSFMLEYYNSNNVRETKYIRAVS